MLRLLRFLKTDLIGAPSASCGRTDTSTLVVAFLVVGLLLASPAAWSLDISGEISIIGDAVNVEFEGRSDWPYEIIRKGNVLELTVPKVDSKTRAKLLSWKGPHVSKIEIRSGKDEKDVIVFFVSKSSVQSFDYLTDQPSRLIVDFFLAEEKKPEIAVQDTSEKAVALEGKTTSQKTNLSQTLPKKGARQPASKEILKVEEVKDPDLSAQPFPVGDTGYTKGVFDGADPSFTRFEIKDYEINPASIIASQQNIYVRFPMLTNPDESLQKLQANSPVYEIRQEDTDENKKARLLMTLFQKNRPAVFLRTIDFFRQAYPDSKYDEILRYMEADIYYKMSQDQKSLPDFQVAMAKYKALLLDYPNSPLADRTHLLVGYSYRQRKDTFGALAQLEGYVRKYPESPQRHQVKIAIADSYADLNKFEEADKILKEVEADKQAGDFAVAAAYKRADLYFQNKNYDLALKTYEANRKRFPGSEAAFPSALYNTAEALFWQGDYKKSLENYKEFLQKFPTSGHGGYAMTRIGELLDIVGADKKKVTGAYLESLFRYRGSQGAGIANIRLLRDRIKDMKPKEVEVALKEVDQFVASSDLTRIKDFEVLMMSDALYDRGEHQKALAALQGFFRDNPTSSNLDIFRSRIIKTLTNEVESRVDRGDFIDAFKIYGQNLTTWLKGADRIDLRFYLGKAYEKAGVPAEAARYYREALNKRYAVAGTDDEKRRMILEKMPTADELNLRLAAVAEKEGNLSLSGKFLTDIRSPLALNPEDQIERVSLSAKVAKAKGDLPQAESYINDLLARWKGQPERLAPSYLELAEVQAEQKKNKDALISLEKILGMQSDTKLVTPAIHAKALELRAGLLLKENRKTEAVEAYQELLDQYEASNELASIRYKTGQLLFEQGKVNEAEKIWSPLAAKPENKLWSQMAEEQLTHSKWQDSYKKYIERIPAMSGGTNDTKEAK